MHGHCSALAVDDIAAVAPVAGSGAVPRSYGGRFTPISLATFRASTANKWVPSRTIVDATAVADLGRSVRKRNERQMYLVVATRPGIFLRSGASRNRYIPRKM